MMAGGRRAMALIATGRGEGIAIGGAIVAFCVYRVVRMVSVWRAALMRNR